MKTEGTKTSTDQQSLSKSESAETSYRLSKSVNALPDIDREFRSANEALAHGGRLEGRVTTYADQKSTLKAHTHKLLFPLVFGMEMLSKRFLPKLPGIGKIFRKFQKSTLLSDIELMGRLSASGFKLEELTAESGMSYFTAIKKGPAKDTKNASYPILIGLKRIGKGGKEIRVYKFRTMYPYSEYLQEEVFEKNQLQEGGKFKEDFRITPWGRWLRYFWLDELPMLVNWLKGDLKLVGVRPLSQQYFNLYDKTLQKKRIQTKPGLLPPYYADMPKTLEEIMASESGYLDQYAQAPFRTDFRYFFKILRNILFRGARSG